MSSTAVIVLAVVILIGGQLWHIQCTDANTGTQYSPNTANASISTKSSQAYINKYLPVMWSALKNANTDKYLLTLRKLQIPSKQLYSSLKICILKYLNAIEPIAFVNATNLPNNSCGYMMLREHVSILHMASTKVFRCLKSYKISTSITYANVTQDLTLYDEFDPETMYSNCLDEVVNETVKDFESVKPRLDECIEQISTPKLSTSNSTGTTADT